MTCAANHVQRRQGNAIHIELKLHWSKCGAGQGDTNCYRVPHMFVANKSRIQLLVPHKKTTTLAAQSDGTADTFLNCFLPVLANTPRNNKETHLCIWAWSPAPHCRPPFGCTLPGSSTSLAVFPTPSLPSADSLLG